MQNINYNIFLGRMIHNYDGPRLVKPVRNEPPLESGKLGIDCAALLSFPGKLKTSQATYDVLGKELDVSGPEAVLNIYVGYDVYKHNS